MNDKHAIRQRIGTLLDECRVCSKWKNTPWEERINYKAICAGCSVYSELRALGEKLITDGGIEDMEIQLIPEEYDKLRKSGLTQPQIAKKLGISSASLGRWVFDHKEEITVHGRLKKTSSANNELHQKSIVALNEKLKSANAEIARLKDDLAKAKLASTENLSGQIKGYKETKAKLLENDHRLTESLEAEKQARRDLNEGYEHDMTAYKKLLDRYRAAEKENAGLKESLTRAEDAYRALKIELQTERATAEHSKSDLYQAYEELRALRAYVFILLKRDKAYGQVGEA